VNYRVDKCKRVSDSRGRLIEFLRRAELDDVERDFGQIYYVTFDSPGQIRGNHYHTRGFEIFGVVSGVLEVALEDVETKERVDMVLDADDLLFTRLRVGSGVAHAFRNISPTAILLDYCSKQYDPADPDRNSYLLLE
jgi:dTDP-4-dehydrorhamnose 3,5-epimerase-like enzyme